MSWQILFSFLLGLLELRDCALKVRSLHGISVQQEDATSTHIPLRMELFFEDSSEFVQESVRSCVEINAEPCSCFEGPIASSELWWTQTCVDKFWSEAHSSPQGGAYFSLTIHHVDNRMLSSEPIFLDAGEVSALHRHKITLVFPLSLDDLNRATLLLETLQPISADHIAELVVLTPAHELAILARALDGPTSALSFPTRVLPETTLIPTSQGQYDGYLVQMALKLLVAKLVSTDFYLTLDADSVCLHPELFPKLVLEHTEVSVGVNQALWTHGRAVYHWESPEVHPHWWHGSARFLDIPSTALDEWLRREQPLGLGATPVVLSTWGAMRTLQLMYYPIGAAATGQHLRSVEDWITIFFNGTKWTEYTLYRLALEWFQVFDLLHIPETKSSMILQCHNVWYRQELPWNATEAFRDVNCLFSVVQSSTGVLVSEVYRQWLAHRPAKLAPAVVIG